MNALRCVKNFNHRRALIVSEDLRATERLDDCLIRLGVGVEYVAAQEGRIRLDAVDLCSERDVLFLDGDLNTDVSVPNYPETTVSLIPVVGMVGIEAPGRLGRLFAHGATAFIKKPIHVGTVFSNLFMAVNEHNQRLAWCQAKQEFDAKRRMRRYVIKAVVLVMEEQSLTDDLAYEWLRKKSMYAQMSIEDLSKRFVESRCEHIQAL